MEKKNLIKVTALALTLVLAGSPDTFAQKGPALRKAEKAETREGIDRAGRSAKETRDREARAAEAVSKGEMTGTVKENLESNALRGQEAFKRKLTFEQLKGIVRSIGEDSVGVLDQSKVRSELEGPHGKFFGRVVVLTALEMSNNNTAFKEAFKTSFARVAQRDGYEFVTVNDVPYLSKAGSLKKRTALGKIVRDLSQGKISVEEANKKIEDANNKSDRSVLDREGNVIKIADANEVEVFKANMFLTRKFSQILERFLEGGIKCLQNRS